jgi:hypothetical protein
MPERAINSRNATGFLLILLPAALAMSALFVAWPFILGGTLLAIGGNVWQSYEWSKTAQSINPVFQQLIVQNRGEITPIDLSITANISGATAQRYLVAKANEFGTGSRQHPDRGQVYYFVSVRTLGDIFDDSERELPELAPATTPVVQVPVNFAPIAAIETVVTPTPTEPIIAEAAVITPPTEPIVTEAVLIPLPVTIEPIITEVAQIPVTPDRLPPEAHPVEAITPELSNLRQLFDEAPSVETVASIEPAPPVVDRQVATILQSELAKRLDVHSSTVYKRRSEPNFTDWTRNRDPDGLAWAYTDETKEYYQVDT